MNDIVYDKNPEKEFFVDKITYSSKDHLKNQGLDVKLKIPASWKAKEGARPHIVQKWEKFDEGNLILTLLTIKPAPGLSTNEYKEIFEESVRDDNSWEFFGVQKSDILDQKKISYFGN